MQFVGLSRLAVKRVNGLDLHFFNTFFIHTRSTKLIQGNVIFIRIRVQWLIEFCLKMHTL